MRRGVPKWPRPSTRPGHQVPAHTRWETGSSSRGPKSTFKGQANCRPFGKGLCWSPGSLVLVTEVQVSPNRRKQYHLDQMKPFLPDLLERRIPLFWVARGKAPRSTGQDKEETWDAKQALQDKVFPNGERKFKD